MAPTRPMSSTSPLLEFNLQMFTIQSCHDAVQSLFAELGVDSAAPMTESMLVRDGFLVGRRFQRNGIRIVWFFDAAEIKVWGADGKLLRVVPLTSVRAMAA